MNTRTLGDEFDARASARGQALAIQEGARAVTYAELLQAAARISSLLESTGVTPGQRVGLMAPNSAAFVAGFFGSARTGAVIGPLNPQYRAQELAYYIADLDPIAVLADERLLPSIEAVLPDLPRSPALVGLGPDLTAAMRRPGSGQASVVPGNLPLLQQYTSGSTGTPKRVIRSHGALLRELATLQEAFGVDERDRFIGVAPFSHVNGLVRTMLTSMITGAALYPLETFKRREVLDLITRERLTFFGGVPQMCALLAQTPGRGEVDLSSIRVAFSSSAPFAPADSMGFRDRYGVMVRQLYGSTETGTISFDRDGSGWPGSVGPPLPGVSVDVLDERESPVAPGVEGEFAIASAFAATEYLGNPEATAQSFRAGCYFPGDLGTRDTAARLTLTGRSKLMINRGGFKVNPYEIEHVIREHPKVADVAVVGVPTPHGDDAVRAVIVTTEPCTADEILSHCRTRIADHKIPADIQFAAALPTSATGKVQRWRFAGARS